MSGRFETLIYTDCRAGQGLTGGAGLQFQARSSGADEQAMSVVQNNLLFEAPTKWMRERRPAQDYPRSFAHVWDGVLATAAGLYLGQEVSSGREGNQLTHAIVTRDPAAYGQVRPAQLFGAAFWGTKPASSTICEPVEQGWQPGPLDTAGAQRFVQGQDHGRELLAGLLAQLQRITSDASFSGRVLFVARDPERVLSWLTAATLLLPQRAALTLGFKIFAGNPAYSRQKVLAMHPDWGLFGATLDNDLGYAVIDLERQVWSPLTATPASQMWTDKFLAEDPYDVVDAVELASVCGLPLRESVVLTDVAIMRRPPNRARAEVIVSWLGSGPGQLVQEHHHPIVDLLVGQAAGPLTPGLLLRLYDTGLSGAFLSQLAQVRQVLFDAEIRSALETGTVTAGAVPLPPPQAWTPTDTAASASRLVEAIRSARLEQIDLLLQLANRFAVALPIAQVLPQLESFVRHWVNGSNVYDPELWGDWSFLETRLRQELERRLQANPESLAEVGERWWSTLLSGAYQPNGALEAAVFSSAMCNLPNAERLALVRRSLTLARTMPVATTALEQTAAGLWQRTAPTLEEARLLCAIVGTGHRFHGSVFSSLESRLGGHSDNLDEDMKVGSLLIEQGLWLPEPGAAQLIRLNRDLVRLCSDMRLGPPPSRGNIAEVVTPLPLPLLMARRERLLDAMIFASAAISAYDLLVQLPWLTRPYLVEVLRQLRNNSDPGHIAIAYVLSDLNSLPRPIRDNLNFDLSQRLLTVIRQWAQRCSRGRLQEATAQVDLFDEPFRSGWRTTVRGFRGKGGWFGFGKEL